MPVRFDDPAELLSVERNVHARAPEPDRGNAYRHTPAPLRGSQGQLAQLGTKNDLRFAPAVSGDEAAYLVLYQALAIYDVSVNLQATGSRSQVSAR